MEYLVNGAEEIFSLQGEKYNQIDLPLHSNMDNPSFIF